MEEFKKGQIIETTLGSQVEILEKLGEGGQGIVYKVKYNGGQYALKWYFGNKINNFNKFYDNIENNIKQGAPTSAFLWPIEITKKFEGSFGYIMDLRPKEYKDFSMFLLAKERFSGIEAVINAALNITKGFRELHNRGYSYQDLNDGNFFVNPKNGDVLICDNDNVAPYGENLGIAGKCRYMAPEVVLGKKRPDIHTDRFSLAVVLYLLFFVNHPLEGKGTLCPCLTEELEHKYYGSNPIFVWDPKDDSNRPVRGVHGNELKFWPVYPESIRNTFIAAFDKEKLTGNDIEHRITEKEWQETFTKLRDSLVVCPKCKSETFINVESNTSKCIGCDNDLKNPMMLRVKRYKVCLIPGKQVFACHTIHDSDDFSVVTGEVIRNKNETNVYGLRNLSDETWTVTSPDGKVSTIAKNGVFRLSRGIKISFSRKNEAEII